MTQRVCRVRPDVPAVDRVLDYVVPQDAQLSVGTIVRVPLQSRKVRGWVIGLEASGEVDRELLPIQTVVSAGPTSELVDLAEWAAWRYAGSPVPFLRACSPANIVPFQGVHTSVPGPGFSARVLAWPPLADRREIIRQSIAPAGSTIVVIPEVRRAFYLARLLEGEGYATAVISGLGSHAERTAAWKRASSGNCVVIGGRVAAWAPVPDLASVLVLDESDETLKEERAPTWNAREVLIERAKRCKVPITLMAPMPSLEAATLVHPPGEDRHPRADRHPSEGWDPVERPKRAVEREGWPLIEIVDIKHVAPGRGVLGEAFTNALHDARDRGERVVCVVNRKGRARLLQCTKCDEIARCERCGAGVEEDGENTLRCPQCETKRPTVCLNCHATKLKRRRVGVTGLRDQLASLVSTATVLEVDASVDEIGAADIYVGTEAVLHRIPRDHLIGLVAFLEFDQELLAARYRANEQAMWLLVRAARLLPARHSAARLLVQTSLPDHEVLQSVEHADPTITMDAERVRRQQLGFPPFGAIADLSGNADALTEATNQLRALGITVLGGGENAHLLVRAETVDELCNALSSILPTARKLGRMRVDVDPVRI